MEVITRRSYCWRWVKKVFATLPKTMLGYIGLAVAILGPLVALFVTKQTLNTIVVWAPPICILPVVFFRIFAAPYWMYKEDMQESARIEKEPSQPTRVNEDERRTFQDTIQKLQDEKNNLSEALDLAKKDKERIEFVRKKLDEQAKYGRDIKTPDDMMAWMAGSDALIKGFLKPRARRHFRRRSLPRSQKELSLQNHCHIKETMSVLRAMGGNLKAEHLIE